MGFVGMMRKEIKEIVKTHKLFVIPVVFLFFGFLSPLTAKYLIEIIKALGGDQVGDQIFNMIPKPKYTDVYVQIFKNLSQIGIIVVLLSFAGTVVEEKVRGTAALVLTKCVSRTCFIVSKFIANLLLFTFGYILSAVTAICYAYLLFDRFYHPNLWLALITFWVYGVLIIAITLFVSTISKSFAVSAVLSFGGYILISALSSIPRIGKYTPGYLVNLSSGLVAGNSKPGDALVPLTVAVGLIMIIVIFCISIFRKQEL